jgi:hypothetical protein
MHLDSTFGWCSKDFRLISIGCNRLGAHYNRVSESLSIVNGETIVSMENSWDATVMGMYSQFKSAQLCDCEDCGFCMRDNANQFWTFAKNKFCKDIQVQQCRCQHATGI